MLGCLPVAALALCAWTACKGKGDVAKTSDLDARCEQLAKACGDKDKHVDKIADGCKLTAPKLLDKGCKDQAIAVYDCYEKELCGKADKVWAVDDLRVLSDRESKCVAERKALTECAGK